MSRGRVFLPRAHRQNLEGGRAVRAAAFRLSLCSWGLVVAATILCLAPPASATAEVATAPYGSNDAGGFRNVLPAGENGLDNATQLAEFQLNGTYPPHFKDQLPLYADLLYASPTLTREQISSYFKDATFGVKQGEVASTESPRAD